MNWATIQQVADNPKKKWFLNQKEVSVMLGYSRQYTAEVLASQSVPYYRIGKERKYFVPELLEIIEKQRWKD